MARRSRPPSGRRHELRGERLRTCVGCRLTAPKRELLRLVSTANGIALDQAMTRPGRGAYVHPAASCVAVAVERGALARALRIRIEPEEASNLLRELSQIEQREQE